MARIIAALFALALGATLLTLGAAPGSLVRAQRPRPVGQPVTSTPDNGVVAPGAVIRRAGEGYTFTEGPAVDGQGNVYFSDVRTSRIHRWSAADGTIALHRDQTGGANGLYFDPAGRLIVCESTNRRLTADDLAGQVTVLADRYDGKRLNSPNDVWVRPDGGIYFSDPRYGDTSGVEQDGMHVYYLAPGGSSLLRVTADLRTPNGLIGSPNGTTLYVADAGAGQVWRYRIQPDGTLTEKSPFVERGVDGMSLDERGNVYFATGAGIEVFGPTGAPVAIIFLAERPSNVTFGGSDFKTLFITARTSVYTLAMSVRGAGAPVVPEASPTPGSGPSATPTESPTGSATASATERPTAVATPSPTPYRPLYLPRAEAGRRVP